MLKWIDALNEHIDNINSLYLQKDYREVVDELFGEVYGQLKTGRISQEALAQIFARHQIKPETFDRAIINAMLISSATMLINSPDRRERERLEPVRILIDRSPKKTAQNIDRMSGAFIADNVPEQLEPLVEFLALSNYRKVRDTYQESITNMNMYFRSNLLEKLHNDIRMASAEDIEKEIRAKWGKKKMIVVDGKKRFRRITDAYIKRAVDTEVHAQGEMVKYRDALNNSYTHKTWISMKDGLVRESHQRAHGQRVLMGEVFNLEGGVGMYPGDKSLPPGERINCRCFMVYDKNA